MIWKTSFRILLLSVAFILCLSALRHQHGLVVATAQEHQATEPPKPENAEADKSAAAGKKEEAESTDEEAKFKQSASVTKFAGWLHITNNQAWWLSVLINFGIVLAAI